MIGYRSRLARLPSWGRWRRCHQRPAYGSVAGEPKVPPGASTGEPRAPCPFLDPPSWSAFSYGRRPRSAWQLSRCRLPSAAKIRSPRRGPADRPALHLNTRIDSVSPAVFTAAVERVHHARPGNPPSVPRTARLPAADVFHGGLDRSSSALRRWWLNMVWSRILHRPA